MIYRLQASILYYKNSGLATWCKNQMDVRYTQAIHLKPDTNKEERPLNKIIEETDDIERFQCDLPLLNKQHAQDAFNTLSTESIWLQALGSNEDIESGSFINLHVCGHDETPQVSCKNLEVKRK